MTMTTWSFWALAALALSRTASCTQGDICYIIGAKTAMLDDKLYFMSGNYSMVSYDGQEISPSPSLFSLNLTSNFPVERSVPQSLITNTTISSSVAGAYWSAKRTSSGDATGALWRTNDALYLFGGGYTEATNLMSAYDVDSETWKNVEVSGGDFNFGNRTSAQSVSVPDLGLGFIYGGTTPYMSGMLRFDASDPNNLTWTNETLGNGSNGAEVPNLESAALVYIPAGKEGMLVSFGGSNVTEGINPDWGWPYDSDWLTIYVYDIASHTWWVQQASGSVPYHRGSFCTAVTASPDNSAFHITAYGGWSLNYGRSYEEVFVLSIPSFTWINVTGTSYTTNTEQQVNSTIGRDSLTGACQTYRDSQMIVLGGGIRAGAYSLTNGACSDVFEPIRVLDLSTYEWQTELDTNSSDYEVPAAIYDTIGGTKTGGATFTTPAGGFVDKTLSSLIQLRVATATATSSTSTSTSSNSASQEGTEEEKSSNTGAIAGGVVGGIAAIALIGGVVWFLRRRRRQQSGGREIGPIEKDGKDIIPPRPPQEMEASYPVPSEVGGGALYELPVAPVELDNTTPKPQTSR